MNTVIRVNNFLYRSRILHYTFYKYISIHLYQQNILGPCCIFVSINQVDTLIYVLQTPSVSRHNLTNMLNNEMSQNKIHRIKQSDCFSVLYLGAG